MAQIDWKTLGFDAYRTRTVVVSHFKDGKWSKPESTETFSFTFDPFAQVFHYAISCFEGLKAFRQKDGRVAMFRPDQNAARLQRTADYLGMPCPDEKMFYEMCEACIRGNMEFLPPYGLGASMYLRPLLVGMHPQMQLVPYPEAVFAVMCAPVGSYYGAHLKSCAAVIPGNYDRAAPKGSGSYKIGANYANTFKPYKFAHEQGYAELLYLNSSTREFVDEFGSSNFFGIKGNKYVTPLSDSVLPSITNKTLQQVAIDLGMEVEKRPVPLEELETFEEVGGCGTAVVITPLSHIDMKPVLEEAEVSREFRYCPDGEVGPKSTALYKRIRAIQDGEFSAGIFGLAGLPPYPPYVAARRRGLLPRVFTLALSGGRFLLRTEKIAPFCAFHSQAPCPVRTFLTGIPGQARNHGAADRPTFFGCKGTKKVVFLLTRMEMRKFLVIACLLAAAVSCGTTQVREYKVKVVREYPHDVTSYTQGLFFHGDSLYESTGQWGESSFRTVDLETGEALSRMDFSRKYFIEGSIFFGDNLYLLTWTNNLVFLYDAATRKYKATLAYPREGWGLTTDGKQLIASDGSAFLFFMDGDLNVERRLRVTMDGKSVSYLNELEYIDGKVWANVYTTDTIVIIDPSDGKVEATVDCRGLLPYRERTAETDVLNGIAVDKQGRIFLTGKYWPKMFEIELVKK